MGSSRMFHEERKVHNGPALAWKIAGDGPNRPPLRASWGSHPGFRPGGPTYYRCGVTQSPRTDDRQTENRQPDIPEPEASKPEAHQARASKPEAHEARASKPEAHEAQAPELENAQPLPPKNFDPARFRDGPVSFVRRGGRMTPSQERAWDELRHRYLIDVPRGAAATSVAADARTSPEQLFGRDARLVVEVGSGQGHAILHASESHPETDFLAIEVFRAGLARTMIRAEQKGLTNLRLAEANAPEVLEKLLPAASLDEVWVFFPDPWAKTKHHKRRIVSPDFAETVRQALKPGGVLRLATDWEEYAEHMREVLDAAPGLARDFDGDWAERFDGRVLTAFEQKGVKKGRAIRDLVYRRAS